MSKKNKSFGEAVAVGSALAGAALGAAAVVLSNKKNQEKIKKTIDGMSHDAVEIGKSLKKKAGDFRKATQKNKEKTIRSASSGQVKKAVKPPVKKTIKKIPSKKSSGL